MGRLVVLEVPSAACREGGFEGTRQYSKEVVEVHLGIKPSGWR